jgi:hypothetical protein
MLMVLSGSLERAGGDLHRGRGSGSRDYGRLFDNLAAWEPAAGADALEYLWRLSEDMYTEQTRDNPNVPAGYTYFAQLINHDLTFDASTSFDDKNVPVSRRNLRTPRFDLDCIYGRGPTDQPYLYEAGGAGRLQLGRNDRGEFDLLRSPAAAGGKSSKSANPFNLRRPAIIGDPRNDENIIIAQMHLAISRHHNRLIDEGSTFEDARRATRWHYQWVAIHDLLTRLCGQAIVEEILRTTGRPDLQCFSPQRHGCIPIEFSLAAFRIGHAMVRPSYALNQLLLEQRGDPLPIFGRLAEDSLSGGRAMPPTWTIQWDLFVDCGGDQANLQYSQALGPRVSLPLRSLPMPPGVSQRARSLAFRTLLRGWQLGLPSGQDVARRMAVPVLDGADPLWTYVLREAEQVGKGHLGPVGGRIVAEVFIGLLAADPSSYLAMAPGWTPSSGAAFALADLLAAAAVPTSRSQWEAQVLA